VFDIATTPAALNLFYEDVERVIRQEEKELFILERVRLAKWKKYMDAVDRCEGLEV